MPNENSLEEKMLEAIAGKCHNDEAARQAAAECAALATQTPSNPLYEAVPVEKERTKQGEDVEQLAINYAADRNNGAGHGYPSYTANLIEKGFIAGYKAAIRPYQHTPSQAGEVERLFCEADMIAAYNEGTKKGRFHTSNETDDEYVIRNAKEYIQTLQSLNKTAE